MKRSPLQSPQRSTAKLVLCGSVATLVILTSQALGIVVFTVLGLATPNLAILIIGSLAVMAAFAWLAMSLLARAVSPLRGRWARATALTAVAVPVLFFGSLLAWDGVRHGPAEAPTAVIEALSAHSHPLHTIRPGTEPSDLEPFRRAVEGRRIVALGEATHGTREFFLLKHRLVEFLVEEMDFRHFAMETHPEHHGPHLDRYIQGEDVDPRRVLYWPWATEEYLALLDWMREYNRDRPASERLIFHGIDPQDTDRDRRMAHNVSRLVEEAGPDARVIVWAANSHIQAAAGGMGQYLKAEFGDDAYLLGLELHQGAFTSRFGAVHTFHVGPFTPDYYSHALAQLSGDVHFVDFRTISRIPELRGWLAEERTSSHLYEGYSLSRLIPTLRKVRIRLHERFDGIVHVAESSPASFLGARGS